MADRICFGCGEHFTDVHLCAHRRDRAARARHESLLEALERLAAAIDTAIPTYDGAICVGPVVTEERSRR